MRTCLITQKEVHVRFHDECTFETLLKNLSDDELILTAILLPETAPASIQKYKNILIEHCLKSLANIHENERFDRFNEIQRLIKRYTPTPDETEWIQEQPTNRLVKFLYNNVYLPKINIGKVSEKTRFLLSYTLSLILEEHSKTRSLYKLKDAWTDLLILEELSFIKEKDDLSGFLSSLEKYFKKKLESKDTFTLKKLLQHPLVTKEDALIWLDIFSLSALERKAVIDQVRKNWRQSQRREQPKNKQKNFTLTEDIAHTLKFLASEHKLTETQVISLLIKGEKKKSTHLKAYSDELKAQRMAEDIILKDT